VSPEQTAYKLAKQLRSFQGFTHSAEKAAEHYLSRKGFFLDGFAINLHLLM